MRISSPARALLSLGAVGLVSGVITASPAEAADSYTVPLHQPTPITAAGFDSHGDCPGIPSTEDGWHFVLPTASAGFVKLTVTFQPGGQQVITSFGPPSDKHAYVGSAPGAELVSATAEVSGGDVSWFNLSHTCVAAPQPSVPVPSVPVPSVPVPSVPVPSVPVPSVPVPSVPVPSVPVPSSSGTTPPSTGPSTGPSGSPTAGTPATPGATGSPSASGAAPAGPSASASASPAAHSGGSLAFTGANVLGTVAAGLALVGLGTALVFRRRKAAGQHS